jgi:hypothetical protein
MFINVEKLPVYQRVDPKLNLSDLSPLCNNFGSGSAFPSGVLLKMI